MRERVSMLSFIFPSRVTRADYFFVSILQFFATFFTPFFSWLPSVFIPHSFECSFTSSYRLVRASLHLTQPLALAAFQGSWSQVAVSPKL